MLQMCMYDTTAHMACESGPDGRQAITWTNADPFYWRIYAALGGDNLIHNLCFEVTLL